MYLLGSLTLLVSEPLPFQLPTHPAEPSLFSLPFHCLNGTWANRLASRPTSVLAPESVPYSTEMSAATISERRPHSSTVRPSDSQGSDHHGELSPADVHRSCLQGYTVSENPLTYF